MLEVDDAAVLGHVVDRHDVGVAQPGHDAGLAQEPVARGRRAGPRGQELDGDGALQPMLPGLVHAAAAAAADLLDQLIGPEAVRHDAGRPFRRDGERRGVVVQVDAEPLVDVELAAEASFQRGKRR